MGVWAAPAEATSSRVLAWQGERKMGVQEGEGRGYVDKWQLRLRIARPARTPAEWKAVVRGARAAARGYVREEAKKRSTGSQERHTVDGGDTALCVSWAARQPMHGVVTHAGEHESAALCTPTAGRLGSPDFRRLDFEKTLTDEINQQVLPWDLAKYSPGNSSPPMSRRHSQHAEKVSSRDDGVRGLKGADVEPMYTMGGQAARRVKGAPSTKWEPLGREPARLAWPARKVAEWTDVGMQHA
ncbi:hypothetical protein EYR38_009888 [Pleurotus pulmonarius]|nr:hypothetical protein EYR38_009888 [Pleurotus pulmonarius]